VGWWRSRFPAQVTGIDAEPRNIAAAQSHAADFAAAKGCSIDYRCTTAEDLAETGEVFDMVVALEIVEHVADLALFLRSAGRLVRPGGLLVLSTINRTPKAFAMAIVGAEYLLGWLPRGTHDWNRFVRPSELAAGLRPAGLAVRELTGVRYQPLSGRFALDPRDLDVNYLALAAKPLP
jgi:2-polyprenyl-6-hydroxyphenyl methylase/3-demethylubiquinone-9 3-methyltransferase